MPGVAAEWWAAAGAPATVVAQDLVWHDEVRDRAVPVRVYRPAVSKAAVPVVIFSHGLGGSRYVYAHIGRHLAAHGYLSVHVQHAGSDGALFGDGSVAVAFLRAVSDPQQRIDRRIDLRFAIDRVLAGAVPDVRVDPQALALAGHSFGAWAALDAVGQGGAEIDERVAAVVALSPIGPGPWGLTAHSWDQLRGPVLFMTGDEDTTLGTADWRSRLVPFERGAARPAWCAITQRMRHHAFGDYHFPGRTIRRDPRHHAWILAVMTAFLDANLREDPAAQAWLGSSAASDLSAGEMTLQYKP
ncbi:MAG: hypothetical protein PF961_05830 [Planctomycetota bacterium]|nr:hypothetical protein [Planctomycetota bacterium]